MHSTHNVVTQLCIPKSVWDSPISPNQSINHYSLVKTFINPLMTALKLKVFSFFLFDNAKVFYKVLHKEEKS